jgi:FAD/FMN-containing dehydrogenase
MAASPSAATGDIPVHGLANHPHAARRATAALHARRGGAALQSPLYRRLAAELRGDVLFDNASRGRYATDASIYQIMPIGVVVPRDEADARLALDIARDFKAPLLPRGGGTSQCGQTVGEALVIDNSKYLNQIIDFDPRRAR